MLRFTEILPLTLSLVLTSISGVGLAYAESAKSLMLGDLAKPAGVEATLALGEGTLVIQLWASWCQNCSTITPKVADAVAAAAKPGVRFLTVSIDDERSDALGYVRKHSALFDGRNLERYHDPAAQVFKQFGLQGIPATVVLHRNGSHQILYGATDLEKLKATID